MTDEVTVEDGFRYVGLGTKNGQPVAFIQKPGQRTNMGQAFAAHAKPVVRTGLLPLTAQQLEARIPELEAAGLANSAAEYRRAHQRLAATAQTPMG